MARHSEQMLMPSWPHVASVALICYSFCSFFFCGCHPSDVQAPDLGSFRSLSQRETHQNLVAQFVGTAKLELLPRQSIPPLPHTLATPFYILGKRAFLEVCVWLAILTSTLYLGQCQYCCHVGSYGYLALFNFAQPLAEGIGRPHPMHLA